MLREVYMIMQHKEYIDTDLRKCMSMNKTTA